MFTHIMAQNLYTISTDSIIDRAVGKDTLSRAIIYDGSKNGRVTELELEVFDPVRTSMVLLTHKLILRHLLMRPLDILTVQILMSQFYLIQAQHGAKQN